MTSACREFDEETALKVVKASFLFNYEGQTQHHHVCLLATEGKVRLQREELSDFRWWNGQTQLSVIPSAKEIIQQARVGGYLKLGQQSPVR